MFKKKETVICIMEDQKSGNESKSKYNSLVFIYYKKACYIKVH